MLASAFKLHDFGVAIAVGLLGELGDKTFFVVLILAVWCPWQGIRDSHAAGLERLLVFAGASAALLTRTIVLANVPGLTGLDCWFNVASGTLLFFLGVRAAIERRILGPEPKDFFEETPLMGDAAADIPADTKWNQAAFSWLPSVPKNPFVKEEDTDVPVSVPRAEWNKSAFPTLPMPSSDKEGSSPISGYGSTNGAPPTSANGILSERISDSLASQIMAAPVACILTFVIQADDKSEEEVLEFGKYYASTVMGAWIGFSIAIGVAVLLGKFTHCAFITRRQILVAVIFVLLSMSLVSFSQAILYAPSLRQSQATSAAEGTGA